jgi:hypothetical protein
MKYFGTKQDLNLDKTIDIVQEELYKLCLPCREAIALGLEQ